MNRKKEIVKPFEFSLRINEHIICQRYFIVRGYNDECRESFEIKEMVDEIMGLNQDIQLGLIPEFFKYKCIDNSHKSYYSQNNHLINKDEVFTLMITKNNVNKLRNKDGDFEFDDLQKETLAVGMFDGKLFHPNVRNEIDIRSIIPDIIKTIQYHLSLKKYTKSYKSVSLVRNNKVSYEDMDRVQQY